MRIEILLLSKEANIPLENFVLIIDNYVISLYVKNINQYNAIIIKSISENTNAGIDYFNGTFENHSGDGSITDLSTVEGTAYVSTMADTASGDLIFDNSIVRNIKMGSNIAIQMNTGGDVFIAGGTTGRYIYFKPQGIADETGVWLINPSRLAPAYNNVTELGSISLRPRKNMGLSNGLISIINFT